MAFIAIEANWLLTWRHMFQTAEHLLLSALVAYPVLSLI
jgi:hypothetical protein